MPLAGLYLHIPFCKTLCPYCDFFVVGARPHTMARYLDALKGEIALQAPTPPWSDFIFHTLYFGGGTPSLLSPRALEELIDSAHRHFQFANEVEVTVEANPGTVDDTRLRDFRALGVNRLSLGVQSFHNRDLRVLGRDHGGQQARDCLEAARRAGFENISLDLIFGIPGQNLDDWRQNLEIALQFQPEHISAYELTYTEGTALTRRWRKGQIEACPEEQVAEMFQLAHEVLEAQGYEHYEISNYARPAHRSHHNEGYWTGVPYLGLGASAHSFDGQRRFWNVASLRQYLQQIGTGQLAVDGQEQLTSEQKMLEWVLLGLRRKEGLSLTEFQEKFGLPFDAKYQPVLEKLQSETSNQTYRDAATSQPLWIIADGFFHLTPRGLLLCDTICQAFAAS